MDQELIKVKRHSGDFDVGCHNLCVQDHESTKIKVDAVPETVAEESLSLYEETPPPMFSCKNGDIIIHNDNNRLISLPIFMEESVNINDIGSINDLQSSSLPEFVSFKDTTTIAESIENDNDYQITALEDVNPILHLNEAELSEFNLYLSQSF